MIERTTTDPLPHLETVARTAGRAGPPGPIFAALDRAMAATIGHRLFTILLIDTASGETQRYYSSQPGSYPVGGRKPLVPGPWTDRLRRDLQPYIGYTAEDIRNVFFDHALIASLGCESVFNLPVIDEGRCLGTINLLHEARWYSEADLPLGTVFAALAVSGFRRLL